MKAHGGAVQDPSQTTETPVELDFEALGIVDPEPAGPSITATVGDQSPVGLSLSVAGSGFSGETPGLYVAFGEAGSFNPVDASGYLVFKWLQPQQIVEGRISVTLPVGADQI